MLLRRCSLFILFNTWRGVHRCSNGFGFIHFIFFKEISNILLLESWEMKMYFSSCLNWWLTKYLNSSPLFLNFPKLLHGFLFFSPKDDIIKLDLLESISHLYNIFLKEGKINFVSWEAIIEKKGTKCLMPNSRSLIEFITILSFLITYSTSFKKPFMN